MALRVVSAILFYPRGGSAHAARALARGLRNHGCEVTLVSGSRSDLGDHGDARRFYGEVRAVDFEPALGSPAPLRYAGAPGTAPMQPSFEDRPQAPDAVFASLDDSAYERQVQAWARELARAGAAEADVLHLHHLTPLNEAAVRVAPQVPVVAQLHGTELLMLERIVAQPPSEWRYADRWGTRMRAWARRCTRVLVPPSGVQRAQELLGLAHERVLELPGGVDVELFSAVEIDRPRFWQDVLVERPRGWRPGEDAGSVSYQREEAATLAAGVVLLYAGRFTAVKRLDRLIGAFARARAATRRQAGLVLVGGHPGEWEGEHPALVADRLEAGDVYLAGWHAHEELPEFFSAADAVVMTSEREQFGQLLVEGMSCGLPALATRSPGPELIVDDGRTGWLVDGEDRGGLVAALAELIDDTAERRRRGQAAAQAVRERFSWPQVAGRLAAVLREAAAGTTHASAIEG